MEESAFRLICKLMHLNVDYSYQAVHDVDQLIDKENHATRLFTRDSSSGGLA